MLEDLIDSQNELDHFALKESSASAARPNMTRRRTKEHRENPNFDDASEAERYYRSQLRLIKRFIDYYKQERQLLEQSRSALPKHLEIIKQIEQALQPVAMLRDWADDEARWSVVQGIEKQINRLIQDQSLAHALSPELLVRLQESAQQIFDQADKLRMQLNAALESPIDPRVSISVHTELDACATFLEIAMPKFEQDIEILACTTARFHDIRNNWLAFIELYTTLPLRLQRRFTIKELSRLSLHPEQEKFISLNHEGCFRLGGVSGSGKSIILVNRALRLAIESPQTSVHVLTINRSLAVQLRGTLEVVGRGTLPKNLNVDSVYDLFQKCISVCHPTGKFRLIDDRSGERIVQSWRDFVAHRGQTAKQNVFADKEVADLVKTLIKRTGSHDAAIAYLRDEVQCVQSAYLKNDRQAYLPEARMGRAFGLIESQKRAVLKVVSAWEEWLEYGGLCDIQTVSLKAAELLSDGPSRQKIQQAVAADTILIDESQDLSTIELIAFRQLLRSSDGVNALFLTGDICQKVYSKHQAIERAGFTGAINGEVLRKNFRNTKEILSAAFRTIASFSPPEQITAGIVTKPEASPYSGSRPLAVDCSAVVQESYIRSVVHSIAHERVAVVTENPILLDALLSVFNDDPMVNCVHVQSNADIDRWRDIPGSPTEVAVFLSTFDAVKGFEFDTVIVADVSERRDGKKGQAFEGFPATGMPDGEHWRCATKFYVACTRARNHLTVTYSGKPSILLKNSSHDFDWIRADDQQLLHFVLGKLS